MAGVRIIIAPVSMLYYGVSQLRSGAIYHHPRYPILRRTSQGWFEILCSGTILPKYATRNNHRLMDYRQMQSGLPQASAVSEICGTQRLGRRGSQLTPINFENVLTRSSSGYSIKHQALFYLMCNKDIIPPVLSFCT